MENKKNRKFQYETDYCVEAITKLKSIECKYHIFGIDSNIIKGYVYFINPRTTSKIKKILNNNVVFIDTNDEISIEEYKQLENVWETGKLLTNGRPKIINATMVAISQPTTIHEETEISSIILNQHN